MGTWWVRHRRLKERLAGSDEWEEFEGTSRAWPLLDGAGNVDDNVLEMPNGTYRAISLRTYEPWSDRWSIWWLDGRNPGRLDPPVVGGFKDGVGTFIGPDTFEGRPILVRFLWSDITATTCRWEQAFSVDDGATWEVNWIIVDRDLSGGDGDALYVVRHPARTHAALVEVWTTTRRPRQRVGVAGVLGTHRVLGIRVGSRRRSSRRTMGAGDAA